MFQGVFMNLFKFTNMNMIIFWAAYTILNMAEVSIIDFF